MPPTITPILKTTFGGAELHAFQIQREDKPTAIGISMKTAYGLNHRIVAEYGARENRTETPMAFFNHAKDADRVLHSVETVTDTANKPNPASESGRSLRRQIHAAAQCAEGNTIECAEFSDNFMRALAKALTQNAPAQQSETDDCRTPEQKLSDQNVEFAVEAAMESIAELHTARKKISEARKLLQGIPEKLSKAGCHYTAAFQSGSYCQTCDMIADNSKRTDGNLATHEAEMERGVESLREIIGLDENWAEECDEMAAAINNVGKGEASE